MNASLDQSLTEVSAKVVRSAISHYHLDLLARLDSIQQHSLHQLGVREGQDDVTIPDLLVGCLGDGFRMQGEIYGYEFINDLLYSCFKVFCW